MKGLKSRLRRVLILNKLDEKLNTLKNMLLSSSKEEQKRLINREIQHTITIINKKMKDIVIGKNRFEKVNINKGFLPLKKKEMISLVPDTRIYYYFLLANSPFSAYLPAYMSLDYKKVKVTNDDFPIIKTVIEDSSTYKNNSIENKYEFKEARNTTIFMYPLNICFYYGDDLQNLNHYTDHTQYYISSVYDTSCLYDIYYFDFSKNVFRQRKGNKIVKPTFMASDSLYYLNIIPEFGYLFELGRLNLNIINYVSDLATNGINYVRKLSNISDSEYEDYLRFMMLKFAEYDYDVYQKNIRIIKYQGYICPGTRYFYVETSCRRMGIKVSLEKYGASKNEMVWDDMIAKSYHLISNTNI